VAGAPDRVLLSEEDLGRLKGLAELGTRRAAEGLSGMVDQPVQIDTTGVQQVSFAEAQYLAGDPQETVALAASILAGAGDPAEMMARLEAMTRPIGTGAASSSAGAATASPAATSAPPAGSQALPPQVARALDQLVRIFPRLELGGGSGQVSPAPGATAPVASGQAAATGITAPLTTPSPSGGPPASGSAMPAGVTPLATFTPTPGAAPAATTPPAAGQSVEAALASGGAGPAAAAPPANTPTLSPLAGQLARVVEHSGRSLESRLAAGATPAETTGDIRALISRLQSQVDEAVSGATGAGRETLLTLQATLRELTEGLESNQLLNSAPATRSNSLDYFVFHLPIHTEDGWESGELRLYKRDGEEEIDPENANIHIRLDLRHLGPVDIGVAFQGDSVSCHFHCEQLESVRLLEDRSSELAKAIGSLGRNVGPIRHSLHRVEVQAEAPQRPPSGWIDTVV
jgi:hypothetical protein